VGLSLGSLRDEISLDNRNGQDELMAIKEEEEEEMEVEGEEEDDVKGGEVEGEKEGQDEKEQKEVISC